ncbi:1-acyl-sn-glycerol-3-phosphate acyltransferase [Streptosporangium album]|uniref:1-acyl-sn-glycerol-3-phosphate acyltransferase n=1 Tax=Streptosporangium album TaxID=47479 RepID=A0A7W7RVB1_9ACTN|nr:lysophospholipid acyltransferase family protein [Streptosporangium album]MBB4938904.1 1-acyl-sn-glycerol-3-phosphate acyltransferase [Streptosporangium album]
MNPWLPVAPCMPATCLTRSAPGVSRLRRTLRLAAVVSMVLAGAVLAFTVRGCGVARRIRLTSAWSRLVLRALGIRVEVRRGFIFLAGSAAGLRVAPSVESAPLIVANHVSWLDPLVMAVVLPSRLLAKREVRGWPVVGGLVAGAGALFIDRERLSALPEAVGGVAAALREGRPVAAFPEGTTWCGREMGAFRPAVFQAALDAGAPVRPVALRYLDRDGAPASAAAYVGDDTLWSSICRVVAFRGLTVEVTLLPPVQAGDRRSLAWAAESSIASVVVAPSAHGIRVAA